MFYGNTPQDTRQFFFTSWQKYKEKRPLLPLEQQIVDIILLHPEYHQLLEIKQIEAVYLPELGQSNPFLHMGLHLTIRDQRTNDRPQGIRHLFEQLLIKHGDTHRVEHLLMEPLAACLWQAGRSQRMPDEADYLLSCQKLL